MTTAMREPRQRALWDVVDSVTFGHVRNMTIHRVARADVEEFAYRWHYTAHMGSTASIPYGLFDHSTLIGVCSFNTLTMPASSAVFGPERWRWTFSMGRLVCADEAPRNSESRLISGALRLVKRDKPELRAIITYAAADVGHVGTVYQATNALYCGTTSSAHYYIDQAGRRKSPKQAHGSLSQAKAIARGWTVHHEPGKHRYVYLLGSRTERREARALLRWPVLPYPKAPVSMNGDES